MNRNKNLLDFLVLVLLGLILLGGLSASVSHVVGQSNPLVEAGVTLEVPNELLAVPATPPLLGEGVIQLGPESFQPYYQSTTWLRSDLLLRATSAGVQPFDAPINPPNGATIKQMVVYFVDNDASANISAYFVRHNLTSVIGVANPTIASNDAASGVRYLTTTAFTQPIDTGNNHYFIRVNLPGGTSNVALVAVRIDYSFTTVLPAIQRE